MLDLQGILYLSLSLSYDGGHHPLFGNVSLKGMIYKAVGRFGSIEARTDGTEGTLRCPRGPEICYCIFTRFL